MFRARVVWSPVELEYLKANLEKVAKDQLCIALSKTRSALEKKIKELKGIVVPDRGVAFQSKIGLRKDLDTFVRSGWEANVMRLFKSGLIDYKSPEYEPQTFSFTDHVPPKGAALSYTPDFRVKKGKKQFWVEVKGNWLRGTDKTKLRRFKKFFPEEFKKLIVIVSSKNTKTAKFFMEDLEIPEDQVLEYNKLKSQFSKLVKNWES
jgi:predicted nuclease of restriction endonuclease-like RecB superfamily